MTDSLIETVSNGWMPFNWGNPFDKQFINACLCLCGHHNQGWAVTQTSALSMTWVSDRIKHDGLPELSYDFGSASQNVAREKHRDHASFFLKLPSSYVKRAYGSVILTTFCCPLHEVPRLQWASAVSGFVQPQTRSLKQFWAWAKEEEKWGIIIYA